jgi:probable phosphoglycerate mutase
VGDAPGQVLLVRHGETAWSAVGRHTSVTDLPLTDVGEEQARALRPRLAGRTPALVLTSPRQRARRTAELAGWGTAEVDEDLVEWHYGDYEGRTGADVRAEVPGWSLWTHPVPGGETADEVAARLDRVVERCRAVTSQGRDALLFAHGHALRSLAARWVGLPVADGRLLYLGTGTLSVLGEHRGDPVVLRWNA